KSRGKLSGSVGNISPSGGIISGSTVFSTKNRGITAQGRIVAPKNHRIVPGSGIAGTKRSGIVPGSGNTAERSGVIPGSNAPSTKSGGIDTHIGILPSGATYTSCPKRAFGLIKEHPSVVIGAGNVVQSGTAEHKMVGSGG